MKTHISPLDSWPIYTGISTKFKLSLLVSYVRLKKELNFIHPAYSVVRSIILINQLDIVHKNLLSNPTGEIWTLESKAVKQILSKYNPIRL